MLLEKLEDRQLLAGAQLIGIQPSDGELLDLDDITELNVAPRDLTFRFDESQQFPAVPDGIRISRAGEDLLLGTADDVIVSPGFLGPREAPNENEIVARFASTLPDDVYRIEIFAQDLPSEGINALTNVNGEPFLSTEGDRVTVDFRLNLGAKIISVVPQPIQRNPSTGELEQSNDTVLVYFNDDDLGPSATDPSFYQLILTNDTVRNTDDGQPLLPTSVTYDADLDLATLTFADDLHNLAGANGEGTFRLRVGTDEVPAAPPVRSPSFEGASDPDVDFQIDLLFPDSTLSERQQEIIRDAADRWEEIIVGDLPNVGLIDDLELTVVSEFRDGVGHFLAHGLPTNLRPDSLLPYQGKLVLDLYDVVNLQVLEDGAPGTPAGDPAEELGTISYNASDLSTIATREIGKALGFGSLWQTKGLIQDASEVDPVYVGANALDEFNAAFNIAAVRIPVENTVDSQGAPTPYNEHWREQYFEPVLNDELMSGFINDGAPNYISRITVGAMEDLGYIVDYGAADIYTGAVGAPYVAPPEVTPNNDPDDSFDTAADVEVYFDTGDQLELTGDATTYTDGRTITVHAPGGPAGGQKFEFVDAAAANGQADGTADPLNYDSSIPTTAADMAIEIAAKITAAGIGVTGTATGNRVSLAGEESVDLNTATGIVQELVSSSVVIPASLDPQSLRRPPDVARDYPFDLPGWIDEPGVRTSEFQEHTLGDSQDFTDEIATIYYNFKEHYGFDVQGNPLSNVITEAQKERAREVFELYSNYLGVQFVETDSLGITVVTGDIRAVRPTVPTGPGDAMGISGGGVAIMDNSEVWSDEYGADWFQEAMRQIGKTLGLGWAYELPAGTVLGDPDALGNDSRVEPVFPGSYDVINGQILYRPQQKDIDLYRFVVQETGTFVAETFAERLHNASSADTVLTLYQVVTDEFGNVVLDHNGEPLKELIARNDDYYSEDSLLSLSLRPGEYFIGVSSTGNENYAPGIEDSGFGGTSEGDYELRMTFRPAADRSIEDDTRVPLDGDGDNTPGGVYNFWFRVARPLEVATHSADEPAVIFVDKSNQPPVGQPQPTGELNNPFNTIPDALNFIAANRASQVLGLGDGASLTDGEALTIGAETFEFVDAFVGNGQSNFFATPINYDSSLPTSAEDVAAELGAKMSAAGITVSVADNKLTFDGALSVGLGATTGVTLQSGLETKYVLRLAGNGGDDGLLQTQGDNIPYELGFEPPFNVPLEDGTSLDVPAGVTVMIDQGVIFKNSLTSINVGSESPSVDRSGGAVQVLGTPYLRDASGAAILDAQGNRISGEVYFTSWNNEAIGADTNPNGPQTPRGGDWGGLLFRNDQETINSRFDFQTEGIFLNHVNHAHISYGGGKVVINSVQQSIDSIHLIEARPTLTYNTIVSGAGSAISADPNSFLETNFHNPGSQFEGAHTSDYSRVGPDIHNNRLGDNNNNALEIRIDTLAGSEVTELLVSARLDDTDIVHTLTQNLAIAGTPGGNFLDVTAPSVALMTFSDPGNVGFNGALSGNYEYIVTFVDPEGNESPPSEVAPAATDNPPIATANANGLLQLNGLPPVPFGSDFVGRRIYRRQAVGGPNPDPFRLIATINGSDTTYVDRGQAGTGILDRSITEATGIRRARRDASLVIDPGAVLKIEGSRIEVGVGAQLIAEGVDGREVIFTSRQDDRYGGSGSFDTNNDDGLAVETQAAPGNWSGIVFGPASKGSLDHVLVTYGGGIGNIGGSAAAFNAIEINQADKVRIANSVVRANEVGQGGQAGQPDSDRFGQGFNAPAAIFVRGSQPVIVNNLIADNVDTGVVDPFNTNEIAAISIDVNSLNGLQIFDPGRSTGLVDAFDEYIDNMGPLVRENRMSGNGLNGMDIRGGVLTTEGVWDDTDITHLLRAEIVIPNFQTYGGLRLESSATESLVIKLESQDPLGTDPTVPDEAGFTATGERDDYQDRIGGMLHVFGQPGHPVVMTSISDDTVGAGFRPDGSAQSDVRDDVSSGTPGDWRSILLDEYSYDNNVDVNQELFEAPDAAAPGVNATPATAQYLGELATNTKSGDESLRLGFIVNGFLNDPQDIDVYSFRAQPGTEVWLDIDRTTHSLDTVIELVNAVGQVIARSDNSLPEGQGTDELYENSPTTMANVLQKSISGEKDHWTTNPRDAGMRIVLPGSPSPSGDPGTFHVRIRSSNPDIAGANPALFQGETSGMYQLQIRLTEVDEVAGSTIRYADIRYATTGIEIYGQPAHSPIQGEAVETLNGARTSDLNDFFPGQNLGNLANQDMAAISVAGTLGVPERPGFAGAAGFNDRDWYRFDISLDDLQDITDTNTGGEPLTGQDRTMPVTFDLDYADGFSRANTIVSVYDEGGRLILTSLDSSIADDRPQPLNEADVDDLSRGTIGPLDPWIGPVELPEGAYHVAVTSAARVPQAITQFQRFSPVGGQNSQVTRLEPISSIERIVDEDFDGRDFDGGDTFDNYSFVVTHDDQNGVDVDKFLPPTTTEIESVNVLDQRGGSNVHDVQLEVLIDDDSPVPWHLGDVTTYVSTNASGGDRITALNPFTGETHYTVGTTTSIQSLVIPDRNFRTFSIGNRDSNAGLFLTLDSGNASTISSNDEGFDTYEYNAAGGELNSPGPWPQRNVAGIGSGYRFEAIERIGGNYFAVGNRPDRLVATLDYGNNVLYQFDSNGNAQGGTRANGSRMRGAGTQIIERGQLLTSIRLSPIPPLVPGASFAPVSITVDDPATGVTLPPISYTPAATDTADDVMNGLLANWIGAGGLPFYNLVPEFVEEVGTLRLHYTGPGDGSAMNLQTTGLVREGSGGSGGFVTGLAAQGNTLYAVTDHGGVFRVDGYRNQLGASANFLFNVFNEGGAPIGFGGAATGPTTDADDYSEFVFAVGDGRMYAVDPTPFFGEYTTANPGQLEPLFFDHTFSVPVAGSDSLAFSTLQTNRWGGAAGNEREQTYDNSRLETLELIDGGATGGYGYSGPNLAGGGYGSVETNYFSLEGYASADQPHLYFDYNLGADTGHGAGSAGAAWDTFRVFISTDGGDWELLVTNDSSERAFRDAFEIQEAYDNSSGNTWRQVRVPLGDFAGQSDLRLRFDYSSAGEMNVGDLMTVGDELRALPGDKLRDEQSFLVTANNNSTIPYAGQNGSDRFEVNLGHTLVAPSGSKLQHGWTFQVDGVTYEFLDDAMVGPDDDKYGGMVSTPGNVAIPYNTRMSAEEVAERVQIAVESNFVPRTFADGTINDAGRTLGWDFASYADNNNDTLKNAVDTGLYFGEGTYTATAAIGDNPNLVPVADGGLLTPERETLLPLNRADDVDMYKLRVNERGTLDVNLDVNTTGESATLHILDAEGNLLAGGTAVGGVFDADEGLMDDFSRTNRPAPQHDDAPFPRVIDPDWLESLVVEEGFYYVVVSADGAYDPQTENSGQGTFRFATTTTVSYDLDITVSNTDAPNINYAAPAPGDEVIYGDDRLESIDTPYAFINTHRDGNRVNVPYAVNITSTNLTGPANTPLARFIEGSPATFVGPLTSNIPILVHSGMSRGEVSDAIANEMADIYQGGDRRLVKGHDGTVRVIAHQISAIDLGPQGNNPGALGQTKFGYTGDFNGQTLPGDGGGFSSNGRAQANAASGIRLDNIIIGFAERGEQVINAVNNTNFAANNYSTGDEVLDGSYQLEIRESSDYSVSIFDTFQPRTVSSPQINAMYRSFDTNARLGNYVSLEIPSGANLYDGQKFTISDGLQTVTFEYDDLDHAQLGSSKAGVAAGNVRIGFRDFESADLIAERVRDAINSPQVQGNADLAITASLSDGTTTGPGSTSNMVNLFGNAIGTLPTGAADWDPYDPYDFGEVRVLVHNVAQDRSLLDTKGTNDVESFYREDHTITGDANVTRRQGQIIVHSNFITDSAEWGVFVTAGSRDDDLNPGDMSASDNPHAGPVANQVVLNTENLVPGVVVSNNVISFSGSGGIHFSGENPFGVGQLAPIPLGRIVNNTVFGNLNRTGVGIDVDNNAAPTLLNNIVANLNQGVVVDNTSLSQTVISGMLYHNNVNNIGGSLNTLGDFFLNVPGTEPMFVDAANGNFYLAEGSLAIDSSVASTGDRAFLRSVRDPLGISPSPIIAPERDVTGQLRVDDQTISTPAGQGENTSVDRGAFDRSDTEGPTALLINPFDNDGFGLDIDPTGTVAFRPDGVFSNFRIQLIDGLSVGSQVDGVGIDDQTVLAQGVTVTRDGRFLTRGIDYTFTYDPTSDLIQLTPLSGIWESDATYVITLNNRDRYVISAVSGTSVADGDQFTVVDKRGGEVVFEYESGYTLSVLPTLSLQVPLQGANLGGVGDGNTFEIVNGTASVVFELDTNGILNDPVNHTPVFFNAGDSVDVVADAIVRAIAAESATLGLSPSYLGRGRVHVGGTTNHALVVNGTGLSGETHSSSLMSTGSPDAVKDGDSFTIEVPGRAPVIFEYDLDGSFTNGTVRIPFRLADPYEEIAATTAAVIASTNLGIDAAYLQDGNVHLGGLPGTMVDVATDSFLTLSGEPGVTTNLRLEIPADGGASIPDNLAFTMDIDGTLRAFEFDSNGLTTSGNQIITINEGGTTTSQAEVVNRVISALANEGLVGVDIGDGVVEIQATTLQRFVAVPGILNPSGVPGGAVPVVFVPTLEFDENDMAIAVLGAIDQAKAEGKFTSEVTASLRGGNTIFVEGLDDPATRADVFTGIGNFYLVGIKDLATNDLKPNQVSEETRFTVLLGDIGLDYSDAPDSSVAAGFRYPTVLNKNGARHVVYDDNPLYLGSRVDVDAGGRPTLLADGDDIEGNGLPFDFGNAPSLSLGAVATPFSIAVPEMYYIQLPAGGGLDLVDGHRFTITNTATSASETFEFDNNGGLSMGTNIAIPFNQGSTEEGLANDIVDLLSNAGLGLLPVNLGDGRVHIGSTSDHTLTVNGASFTSGGVPAAVQDGETFEVTTINGPLTFEFDADFDTADVLHVPITFDARSTHEDIASTMVAALLRQRLGVTPLHLGDGVIELDGDDEDGVSFDGAFNSNLLTPITVTASETGLLDAWIDFNGDGDFADVGEKIFNSLRLAPGDNQLTVQTPATAVAGTTYARFRFSDLGGLGATGLAASGEVEDYQIDIRPGNPPVAGNDPGTGVIGITEDQTIAYMDFPSVLDNDIDPDGDPIHVEGAQSGPLTLVSELGGLVQLREDGFFTYDGTSIVDSPTIQALEQGEVVQDTFTYRATDDFLFSNIATVTITITGVNDAPTAGSAGGGGEFQVFEDGGAITGQFPANDIDGDNDFSNLIYTITQGAQGAATSNGDGTFTFSPNPFVDYQYLSEGEIEQTVFTFTAEDAHGATSGPGNVTVNVRGVNDVPTVAPTGVDVDLATFDPANPPTGDFMGSDLDTNDQGSLIYTIFTQPLEGQFVIDPMDPTKFTFDPIGFFTDLGRGETRTVTGSYTATDPQGETSFSGLLTATVTGENDPPVANPDPAVPGFYSTDEDTLLSVIGFTSGLLFNDSDPDGDAIEVVAPFEVVSNLGAEVTLNANGTFTYDPRPSAILQSLVDTSPIMTDTFEYSITDNDPDTVPVSATVAIQVSGVNDAPGALDFTMGRNGIVPDGTPPSPPLAIPADSLPVIVPFDDLTGLDPDGGGSSNFVFTVIPGTGPQEGRILPKDVNGDYYFDPRPVTPLDDDFLALPEGVVGQVDFQYRVQDQSGLVSPDNGLVTVLVVGVNDAPVARDDTGLVNEAGTSILIDLLANDFDVDSGDALTVLDSTDAPGTLQAANGVVFPPDASGRVLYSPNPGFTGTDTFTYKIRDALGLESAEATVTVTTTEFPSTNPDGGTTFELEPLTIDVLANDSDPDGTLDPASVQIVTNPSDGIATVDPTTGAITYLSDDIDFDALGVSSITDVLQYTVKDNDGAESAPTNVTIEVVPNDKPFQNPRNHLDVNADTLITPFDLLLVLRHLQVTGFQLPDEPPPPYVDVNGDNVVTPSDLRLVLAELNQPSGQGEAPEGEAGSLVAAYLAPPVDVSLQHSSFADPALAEQPLELRSDEPVTQEVSIVESVAYESVHLLRDEQSEEDELDSYLDTIAEESKRRMSNEAVDRALIDLLLE